MEEGQRTKDGEEGRVHVRESEMAGDTCVHAVSGLALVSAFACLWVHKDSSMEDHTQKVSLLSPISIVPFSCATSPAACQVVPLVREDCSSTRTLRAPAVARAR